MKQHTTIKNNIEQQKNNIEQQRNNIEQQRNNKETTKEQHKQRCFLYHCIRNVVLVVPLLFMLLGCEVILFRVVGCGRTGRGGHRPTLVCPVGWGLWRALKK